MPKREAMSKMRGIWKFGGEDSNYIKEHEIIELEM